MAEGQVVEANTSAIINPRKNTVGSREELHSFEVDARPSEAR